MKIVNIAVPVNKVQFTANSGNVIPPVISRAWSYSVALTEDLFLEDAVSGMHIPFLIIPKEKATITVGLVGNSGEEYVISEAETEASLGLPMLYLVERIYSVGTAITKFSIGI